MFKRFAVLLFAGIVFAQPTAEDRFYRDVVEFDKHWVAFLNGLIGCPASHTIGDPDTECSKSNRKFNLEEFNKAKRLASRVFQAEIRP